jgi:hypothetical protein
MNHTRTALYYPEIVIPSKEFIRKTILYWDDIGSIVPKTIWDEHPYFDLEDQETNQLRDAHLYRPFFPHTLSMGGVDFQRQFSNDFYKRLDFFNQRDALRHNTKYTPVYETKEMVPGLFDELAKPERGLAKRELAGVSVTESNHAVYFIESITANIYMALLAESLAEADKNITVPITEDTTWQDYAYAAIYPNNQNVCAKLVLDRILPTPSPDVPLEKLIDFKEDHRTELIQLRKAIDGFQTSIAHAPDIRTAQDSCCKFSEDFGSGVKDINRNLHDRNINTVFGSLNSLMDVKSPEISATLIGSGALTLGTLQPLFLLSGIIMAASIKIEAYLLKEREERRKWMESLPYSYVYHLQKSGIAQQ